MRGKRVMIIGLLALLVLAGFGTVQAQDDPGGRICVLAFNDANGNTVRDPMEPLLADVVASLQDAQAIGIGSYVTTGQAEPYCFTELGPGTYTVIFEGGLVDATGQNSFSIVLNAGQTLPAQAQFGAVPVEVAPVAASPAAAPAADSNTLLRVALALGGAGVIMVLLAGVGFLIYWTRFRDAAPQQ
jgi:hypothetical protein